MNKQTSWLYERAEGRTKHCWANDYADFTPGKRGMVGQCHASLTNEIATQLLQNGVPYNAPGTDVAEHVYAVYRGVIYEAAPTQPGLSFHGYPWRGDQGRPALPTRIRHELRTRAQQSGHLTEFEKWLKKYN